jgi:site-specific DNA-methyltransferase (adenine-specific)
MTAWRRHERIGDCDLYLGDCLEVMPELGRFDAVVTSPPYGNIRDYGEAFQGVDCNHVISNIASLLIDGGVCMWNTADQTINGSESGESFRQALHALDAGLRLHDTMIYCKESVSFPDSNRYLPCFEYMFVFSKGAPKTFNPIKDRRNKWAGAKMHGTDRQKDGTTVPISQMGKEIPRTGIRRNWWIINEAGESGNKHPARMPYSMAYGHVETWTLPGEAVLDPFMGSGTTGVACVQLGRKFTGIELDPDYFDIACERIAKAVAEPRLPLDEPKAKPEQFNLLEDSK